MGKVEDPLLGEGGPGKARDGCGAAPYRSRTDWNKESPAGGSLPPRGRWQGAALTDEGPSFPEGTGPGLDL